MENFIGDEMTFYALHYKTKEEVYASELYTENERVIVNALHKCGIKVEDETSIQKDWFKNEKFLCPPDILVNSDQFPDLQVTPTKDHDRRYPHSTEKLHVRACFRIPDKEERGIKTIAESDEHKNAIEAVVSELFGNQNLIFCFGNFNLKLNELNWVDFKKRVEKSVYSLNKNSNISDVFIETACIKEYIGAGICIEVQFSQMTTDERKFRTESWANMGYSIAWLGFDDFDWSDKEHPKLILETINVIPCTHANNLRKERNITEIDYKILKMEEQIQETKKLNEKIELRFNEKIEETDHAIDDVKGYFTVKQSELTKSQQEIIKKLTESYYTTTAPIEDAFKTKISSYSNDAIEYARKEVYTLLTKGYLEKIEELIKAGAYFDVVSKIEKDFIKYHLEVNPCLTCEHASFHWEKDSNGKYLNFNQVENPELRFVRYCKIAKRDVRIDQSDCRSYIKRRA